MLISGELPRPLQDHTLLVGIAEEGIGGIGTYAECIAAAAALSGHKVTLLVTTRALAETLRARTEGSQIEVIDLGLKQPGKMLILWRQLCPGAVVRYLRAAARKRLKQLNRRFDLAHLNIPPLAATVRPFAEKVFVAAWFYPHNFGARMRANWQDTAGRTRAGLLRRIVIMAKSISLYRGDQRGFRASDMVIAPTELLANQLRQSGLPCHLCHPPVWSLASSEPSTKSGHVRGPGEDDRIKLVACCADLSHPRKNVSDILAAAEILTRQGAKISLELIGGGLDALKQAHPGVFGSIAVTAPGPLPRELVHRRVSEADLFITSARYEEWGYAAVEALLLGVPVVAYPVYPFPELLGGGLGVVAKETTPQALAEAILQATRREGLCSALAAAAQDRFGIAAIGTQLTRAWSLSA
jgi:glycosyltransferase involved in cell wall biosynthesis